MVLNKITYIMDIKIESDYGTLKCQFNDITVWFCDNSSNELFENLSSRLYQFSEDFPVSEIEIDIDKMVAVLHRRYCCETLPVSLVWLFRPYPECDLLSFVNLFLRKRISYVNGKDVLTRNINYIRLNLRNI